MIIIKNRQRTIDFSTKNYQEKAQKILDYLGYNDFDIGILLTTDKTIQQYNRQYRNQDKPTDVLSFPYHKVQAGKKIKVTADEDKNLGDIVISVSYVFKNKKNLKGDFNARMDRMLVHAICHLLGYDHIKDADYKKMITLENKLMKLIA
ncbi:MAG TPA: rRNA maturation RNase YbeY [Candidatus Saccharimonadales bacterium]|nr:rRNA maturation RNase YbeY [Candidatus Saccharimonadales bacterium]